MAAKTISFPKGKGHLTHNNRKFICNNVVLERTSWNRTYIQEPLKDAYEKCFGQALRDYNAAQKRKVLSCKLDAPAPCRLDAPDFSFVCHVLADCLHQHWQAI